MKPYVLVMYNKLKFIIKKIYTPGFCAKGMHMFGRNSKFHFNRDCHIEFGDRIFSDGRLVIIVDKKGSLKIGDKVYFNENMMISCKGKITIGDGCQFGPNVKIFDNNHKFDPFHGVLSEHSIGTVEIGEKCWIGTNVVLLKGAKIGRNSVIGAGCIINRDIPEASIVTQGRDLTIQRMK